MQILISMSDCQIRATFKSDDFSFISQWGIFKTCESKHAHFIFFIIEYLDILFHYYQYKYETIVRGNLHLRSIFPKVD